MNNLNLLQSVPILSKLYAAVVNISNLPNRQDITYMSGTSREVDSRILSMLAETNLIKNKVRI